MRSTISGGSVRERLLAAANELFYAEGHHTVGIDRVIERAGVAKASLYTAFGSKEDLVEAYLLARADARRKRIEDRIATLEDPRERIFAIFELVGELAAAGDYRGCAFVRASAEGPRGAEPKVSKVCVDARAWTRSLFVRLAREAGAYDPELLGGQLGVVYDGVMVGASMDKGSTAPRDARATVAVLLDVNLKKKKRARA